MMMMNNNNSRTNKQGYDKGEFPAATVGASSTNQGANGNLPISS